MSTNQLQLAVLEKEYDIVLKAYEESIQTYIESLNVDANTNKSFVRLPRKTWWGSESLQEKSDLTVDECEALCASSKKCSGATFNTQKRHCWTRAGTGKIKASSEADNVAIVPTKIAALQKMNALNDKLVDLNQQISDLLGSQGSSSSSQDVTQQLDTSYENLLRQKLAMGAELQDYYSIQQNEENQHLYANQQQITMRFLWFIVCLLMLFALKQMYEPPIPLMMWFGIVSALMVMSFAFKNPMGFVLVLLVLMGLIVAKT